jgi:hypothetical protein
MNDDDEGSFGCCVVVGSVPARVLAQIVREGRSQRVLAVLWWNEKLELELRCCRL